MKAMLQSEKLYLKEPKITGFTISTAQEALTVSGKQPSP
jgi:hypothetical protein